MLMKWSDLIPGDVLEYTQEFKNAVIDSPWFSQELLKYKRFIIRNIYNEFDIIKLFLYDYDNKDNALYRDDIEVWITDGGKMWRPDNVQLPIMFEIIELRKN